MGSKVPLEMVGSKVLGLWRRTEWNTLVWSRMVDTGDHLLYHSHKTDG